MDSSYADSDRNSEEEKQQTTSKVKKRKIYQQKYKSTWESEFKCWLHPSSRGQEYFKCIVCAKDYIGGLAAIKKHIKCIKHNRNINSVKKQQSIADIMSFKKDNLKKTKLKLVRSG